MFERPIDRERGSSKLQKIQNKNLTKKLISQESYCFVLNYRQTMELPCSSKEHMGMMDYVSSLMINNIVIFDHVHINNYGACGFT